MGTPPFCSSVRAPQRLFRSPMRWECNPFATSAKYLPKTTKATNPHELPSCESKVQRLWARGSSRSKAPLSEKGVGCRKGGARRNYLISSASSLITQCMLVVNQRCRPCSASPVPGFFPSASAPPLQFSRGDRARAGRFVVALANAPSLSPQIPETLSRLFRSKPNAVRRSCCWRCA